MADTQVCPYDNPNQRHQILKKKKDNPNADTGELEREIDRMVYKLYDLTEEEIRIIENKAK